MRISNLLIEQQTPEEQEKMFKWIKGLNQFSRKSIYLSHDGTLGAQRFVRIEEQQLRGRGENRGVPYKFGFVRESFMVIHCPGLTSLKNFPNKVGTILSMHNSSKLSTIEGITPEVGEKIDISDTAITNLAGIHKKIKSIGFANKLGGAFRLTTTIESSLLGTLLINDLKFVELDKHGILPPDLASACEIISRHLNNGRDVLDCQEELIKAGLKEYAKL